MAEKDDFGKQFGELRKAAARRIQAAVTGKFLSGEAEIPQIKPVKRVILVVNDKTNPPEIQKELETAGFETMLVGTQEEIEASFLIDALIYIMGQMGNHAAYRLLEIVSAHPNLQVFSAPYLLGVAGYFTALEPGELLTALSEAKEA